MSNGSRRIRQHNKLALSRFSTNHRYSLNLSPELSKYETFSQQLEIPSCKSSSPENKSAVSKHDFRKVISNLKSQKDLFTPCYLPHAYKPNNSSWRRPADFNSCSSIVESSTNEQSINSNLIGSKKNLFRSGTKSGRMSQLAGRVEQLIIQETSPKSLCDTNEHLSNVIENKCDSVSSVIVDSLDVHSLKSVADKIENHCVVLANCNKDKSDLTRLHNSPWYRYCRPKAPFPSVSSNIHESPDESSHVFLHTNDRLTVNKEQSFKPLCNNRNHGFPNSIVMSSPIGQGDSQENINWNLDLTLPPPPSNEISDLDRSYSFPSPPLDGFEEIVDGDDQHDALQSNSDVVLKPLASITNIITNHVNFGRRHPKWAIDNRQSDIHVEFSRSRNNASYLSDRDFVSSPPVPSSPPLIIEQPTHVHNTSSPLSTDVNGLTRPTVLKREAPDGAEHCDQVGDDLHTVCLPVFDLKKHVTSDELINVMKRNSNCDSLKRDYAPKKSRTYLLLPSEHSAFLPVGEAARQLQRVSISPCLR